METPNVSPGEGPGSAPPLLAGARGLLRWVCTNNPFYVLSAWLVCVGLWVSFGAQENLSQTWALSGGMAGYALLLAATACILVRSLGAWDDVRTVMLLVAMMLLAISVTFDVVLARDPKLGAACAVGGLAFAVAVSEGVLRGTRLRMPAGFRIPYYLFLGLFFLYPPAIGPLVDRPRSEELSWALFGFAPLAGLVALALIPAARRGGQYLKGNGSPWRWPLYPWTLFGLIGLAAAVRGPLLCRSMQFLGHPDQQLSIFGPYFLVPLGLAAAVLLLEGGLAAGSRGAQRLALVMPIGVAALAAVGHRGDRIYEGFLGMFEARLGGTPLYIALMLIAGFAVYAMARRVRGAFELLSAAFAAFAVVGPSTLDWHGLTPVRPLPLLGIAALQLGLGWHRGQSWRSLLGAGALAAAAAVGLEGAGWGLEPYRGPIALLLGLLAVLGVGAAFDDPFARWLRDFGALLGGIGALAAATGGIVPDDLLPWWGGPCIALAAGAAFAAYGRWLGNGASLAAGALSVTSGAGSASWRGYQALRGWASGLDYIAAGLALFALAAFISAVKGGAMRPLLARIRDFAVEDFGEPGPERGPGAPGG